MHEMHETIKHAASALLEKDERIRTLEERLCSMQHKVCTEIGNNVKACVIGL